MKSSFSSDAPTYVHRFGMPARVGGGATSALSASLLGAAAPAHQNLAKLGETSIRNSAVVIRNHDIHT